MMPIFYLSEELLVLNGGVEVLEKLAYELVLKEKFDEAIKYYNKLIVSRL